MEFLFVLVGLKFFLPPDMSHKESMLSARFDENNTLLNKSQAWHIDGLTNKKIHMIFINF